MLRVNAAKAGLTAARDRAVQISNSWVEWYRRRNTLGARGERVAARYLRRKKRMHIIEISARSVIGEIDIVAADRHKTKIIFVEVKTRVSHDRGHPAEAVTPEKQHRISRTALAYLKHHNLLDTCAVRFDVVAITWPRGQRQPTIEHLEDAFEAVGRFQLFS